MKFFLLTFFILATGVAYAQSQTPTSSKRPDSVGYYMRNDHEMAYSEKDANFVRLLIKADSGMFRVNDYYMNGNLRLATLTTLDSINFEAGIQGICYEYYNDGKRKSIKNFNNGQITGDVVSYYPNGSLHSIESYSPNGVYLKQCMDSVGTMLANDGNGRWLKIDMLDGYMEGPVLNGKENGEWKKHVADTVYTIIYKQGEIISGKEFLKIRNEVFVKVEIEPTFPGGDAALAKFLSRNMKYPVKARENKTQGRVILTFVIEKDGTLTNLRVVRGIGNGCDEEAIRVLSLSPKWKPGLSKGKPVRVQYSIPINYSL